MNMRAALLAATILASPLAAQAEAVNGLYIGAGAGANWLNDTRLRSADIGGANVNLGKTRQRFDTGFRTVASVGYGLGNGLRVELEGTYFQNSLTRVGRFTSGGGIGGSNFQPLPTTVTGDRLKYGGFFNVLYDFDPNVLGLGNVIPYAVSPYIGLGAGYLQAQNSDVRYQSGNQALIRSTGTDGNFAYQAIIGAAFPISSVPGLSVTAEYRFTGIADNTNFRGQYFAPGVATRAILRESDQYNHSAMLGVRYAFNAAPPPPPPAAPAPVAPRVDSRTYLVFFDWDRADLTDRARQIIAEAAQGTQRVQTTRIEVNGYTDSSGTPRYNQGLSVRRAQNVAAELVRQGVPRQAITVQGFGETNPLVPTAQGVREPQNRRVQIILR